MLGEFSDAFRDYARVTANVLPVHPNAATTILDGYAARLAQNPDEIPALTGLSFAQWWLFGYAGAINVLNDLLALEPDDVYGNLFRGFERNPQGWHAGPRRSGHRARHRTGAG
jgi:hypothetical protein